MNRNEIIYTMKLSDGSKVRVSAPTPSAAHETTAAEYGERGSISLAGLPICGKRTARFICTLDRGHCGAHGRAYRR